jgi:hypothetical protein
VRGGAAEPESFLAPTEEPLPKAKLSPPGEAPRSLQESQGSTEFLILAPKKWQVDRLDGLHRIEIFTNSSALIGTPGIPGCRVYPVGILFGPPQRTIQLPWCLAASGLPGPAWLSAGLVFTILRAEQLCLSYGPRRPIHRLWALQRT